MTTINDECVAAEALPLAPIGHGLQDTVQAWDIYYFYPTFTVLPKKRRKPRARSSGPWGRYCKKCDATLASH